VALAPAITDLEQLKERPAVARLLAWRSGAISEAKFDRGELSVTISRNDLRDACSLLREDAELKFNFLSDITCVDRYPLEPRFEVIYHLLSHGRRERLRLKVKLGADDATVDSLTSIWPAANFFEREVYDLFGVRFSGHPDLRRILMPDNWDGHPLRKDYPVEGFR
jgi:NADH-quinone oxidoreductase subunit C